MNIMFLVTCVYSTFLLVISCVDAQLQVRLVNGAAPWTGRLEMYNGTWHPVCVYGFKREVAQVTCRMLGINASQALAVLDDTYRLSSSRFVIHNLRCTGEETSLDQCRHTEINIDSWCPYVIGVTCNTQYIGLRLRDTHNMRPNRGQVQIHIGVGDWRTVCVSTNNTARVVCRQLGLPWNAAIVREIPVESSIIRVTHFLFCLGNETSSLECQHETYHYRKCRNYDIICSPVNIYTNGNIYPLMEETKATLKCESNERSDVIKYTWPEDAGGFPDGSSLIITRVTREHHGRRVRCEAMYSDGEVVSSDTLQLQVYYHPVISIRRSDNQGQPLSTYSEVIKGQSVTFVCDADTNPPPASITWSGKVNSTTGELHIIAAQQTRHSGNYTCTVVTETVDDDGLPLTVSSRITLDVKVSVYILTNSSRYPLMEETNATLKCASNERSDVIKYTWPENAGGFPDGSSLIITRVTREHHGRRVRCETISSDGEVFSSDTLQLQVYYRPVIRITRSDNQRQPLSTYSEVIKGQTVTFGCDADSNPPPASITWSGKVSSTTGELHIIAAQQTTHEGIYTCTVVTETNGDDERLPLRASSQITFIVKVKAK